MLVAYRAVQPISGLAVSALNGFVLETLLALGPSTIATGTLAGMGAGALSPVKGFSSLATSVGGGLVSGAIANLASDLEGLETTDE